MMLEPSISCKMNLFCVLLIVGIFCLANSAEVPSASAIRIVSPKDHVFNLELDEFNSIVNDDNLKDRNVVIVSIAGAFREGKSFPLNFFLKYLNAQVFS